MSVVEVLLWRLLLLLFFLLLLYPAPHLAMQMDKSQETLLEQRLAAYSDVARLITSQTNLLRNAPSPPYSSEMIIPQRQALLEEIARNIAALLPQEQNPRPPPSKLDSIKKSLIRLKLQVTSLIQQNQPTLVHDLLQTCNDNGLFINKLFTENAKLLELINVENYGPIKQLMDSFCKEILEMIKMLQQGNDKLLKRLQS